MKVKSRRYFDTGDRLTLDHVNSVTRVFLKRTKEKLIQKGWTLEAEDGLTGNKDAVHRLILARGADRLKIVFYPESNQLPLEPVALFLNEELIDGQFGVATKHLLNTSLEKWKRYVEKVA